MMALDKRRLIGLVCCACFLFTLGMPFITSAQVEYTPLAPIPLDNLSDPTRENVPVQPGPYIEGLFRLAIGIAGALAVIMIIVGGIQYISTDSISGTSSAKKTIENAIWGLMLAISAWLILYTINPQLVEFDLNLQPIESTEIEVGSASVNGPRLTAEEVEASCPECVSVVSLGLPAKPPGAGCWAEACYLHASLANKLKNLQDELSWNIEWQITEMYPPTKGHNSSCHKAGQNAGKCADIAIDRKHRNGNCINPGTLKRFFEGLEAAGLGFQYEVMPDCYRAYTGNVQLRNFRNKIVEAGSLATGEHAHVNL